VKHPRATIAIMARVATMRFTAVANDQLAGTLRRHIGARRFAWNRCLQAVNDARRERRAVPEVDVPWSGYSLINWFNAWKRSSDAGQSVVVDPGGGAEVVATGLPWRHEVCAQVFEEAAVDLGRSLAAYRNGKASSSRPGFPDFKKKGRGVGSFRLRNKASTSGRPSIRVGEAAPRSITLPVIGVVRVREDTRRLRRLLGPGPDGEPRGRICTVTVSERGGRFVLAVTCELADLHPGLCHSGRPPSFVGLDRGLSNYVVAADAAGTEIDRIAPPRCLARALAQLRRADRAASRKCRGSANRAKANRRRARLHARVAARRRDFLHRTSTRLVKTHHGLCVEDLAVKNLMRNRHLSRAIADAGWGQFATFVAYKASWYHCELVVAPRFFASTRTCSGCGHRKETMALSDRQFSCAGCGLAIDRDTNAAANLAAWGEAEFASATQVPDPEARGRVTNACGGRSAGRHDGDGGTAPANPLRGKKQEPTLADLA
jgi:putative transposase